MDVGNISSLDEKETRGRSNKNHPPTTDSSNLINDRASRGGKTEKQKQQRGDVNATYSVKRDCERKRH